MVVLMNFSMVLKAVIEITRQTTTLCHSNQIVPFFYLMIIFGREDLFDIIISCKVPMCSSY